MPSLTSKTSRYGTVEHAQNSFDRADPMELSHADEEEDDPQAVE